jgi:hypothetical protein
MKTVFKFKGLLNSMVGNESELMNPRISQLGILSGRHIAFAENAPKRSLARFSNFLII